MAATEDIYLDYCATTPMDAEVMDAMLPYFHIFFGNPSSRHRLGRQALDAVRHARQQVADLVGARPGDVVFASGATEALNLAIRGIVGSAPGSTSHLLASAIEHKAVLATLQDLATLGCPVRLLPPDVHGRISPAKLAEELLQDSLLATVMWVNNETGTVQPVRELAAACAGRGTLFLTDATQAAGRIPIDVNAVGVDALALSAHKIYGPKGVGALVANLRFRTRLAPQATGGGQEAGLRSGTLNVPGIVGFGAACDLARRRLDDDAQHCLSLRNRLEAALQQAIPGTHVHGSGAERAPHCLNVGFDGVDGEALLANLDRVMISTGSACNSMVPVPSHVLLAMGYSSDEAFSAVRLSVGRGTTQAQIDAAVRAIAAAVARIRSLCGEG